MKSEALKEKGKSPESQNSSRSWTEVWRRPQAVMKGLSVTTSEKDDQISAFRKKEVGNQNAYFTWGMQRPKSSVKG